MGVMIFLGQLQGGLRSPSVSSVIESLAVITYRKFHNQFLTFLVVPMTDRMENILIYRRKYLLMYHFVVQKELVILNKDCNLFFSCVKRANLA